MSQGDREVRRASRHLDPEEVVLASVVGREADGRRRRVVLVTDQRVLISGTRGDEPMAWSLDEASASFGLHGGLLTLRNEAQEVAVRDIDEMAARSIVQLLTTRTVLRSVREATRPPGSASR